MTSTCKRIVLAVAGATAVIGMTVVAGAPVAHAAGSDLPVAVEPEADLLKCRRVSRRFSICGDTNFKNKVVAGFGVHFSTVDPNGRLRIVGAKHEIEGGPQSCDRLLKEPAVPLADRRRAVGVCRQMIGEHRASRRDASRG